MAEKHVTFTGPRQVSGTLDLSGSFKVTIHSTPDWSGVILLEKKYSDYANYIPVTQFFRSGIYDSVEPALVPPTYRLRVVSYGKGSAYARMEDGGTQPATTTTTTTAAPTTTTTAAPTTTTTAA